ncbi:MAG TPA: penicillin-binding protein [Candidatus Hydrogenedentes bacterium]|nr:penicillin-binding protein [Candidatus Hydrogenedentota bacterium]
MIRPGARVNGSGAATSSVRRHRIRLRLVYWGLLASFAAVTARLVQLQAFPDDVYTREEGFHEGTVPLLIPRGDIYDRNGRLLATDRQAVSLVSDPFRVEAPEELARGLSELLESPEDEVLVRLTKRDEKGHPLRYSRIKRRLSTELLDRLNHFPGMNNPSLWLENEPVRVYPDDTLAAHVLGFVNGERTGSGGIEMIYDHELGVTPGKMVARVDCERTLLGSRITEYVPPQGGADLTLTLDRGIQHKLEQELAKALEKSKAIRGMGIVMDPHTGAILALACFPTFDPNRYNEFSDEERKNSAITDVFEPGSSFKIVTASAAIELGLVTPETMINCENGAFNPYGHRIRDYHSLGVEPFRTCFAESSNIAMIKVAAMLGRERLEEWIRRFGFGQTTGPDFGGAESAGIFRGRESWSKLSMGSLPMGQEISVTLPQLARAFAAIANGGYLVEPYLVSRVTSPDGTVVEKRPQSSRKRIISEQTAQTMKELCHGVVLHGTGDRANIEEYRVGGKTGTAQVARTDGRGYAPGKYNTIFAGFAPVAYPRVVAVIVVREPEIREHWGGYVCGPVFREVVRDALIGMHCPEDPVKHDIERLAAQDDDPDTVMAQEEMAIIEPDMDSVLTKLDGLELIEPPADFVSEGPILPDFVGMTKREARQRIAELGVAWDIQGSGWVAEQEPPPGTPLSEVVLCRLRFSNERKKADDETSGVVTVARR